jgi:hypothetical protein
VNSSTADGVAIYALTHLLPHEGPGSMYLSLSSFNSPNDLIAVMRSLDQGSHVMCMSN